MDIAVISRDDDFASVLSRFTSSDGYDTQICKLDDKLDAKVILLDVDNIEMSDVYRAINQSTSHVIILSSYMDKHLRSELYRNGIYVMIQKPCEKDELMTMVHRAYQLSPIGIVGELRKNISYLQDSRRMVASAWA